MTEIRAAEFLTLAQKHPVVDVRSPAEYAAGHIPGAFNLPLFENEERSIVGILYKNKGRREAIRKGLEIVGPKMTALVDQAIALADDGRILVHCWRGGMRSSSVAWLFESAGLEVFVLSGGYKNYRHFIRKDILSAHHLLVLGGMTGSGKTILLQLLKQAGEPVIDLEGLANHRGSAFGGVGLRVQPSTEHFENLLYAEIKQVKRGQFIWVEDESRRIGDIFLPDNFHQAMRLSPVVIIQVSDEERRANLVNEYAIQPDQELMAAVDLLEKRVGGLIARESKKLIAKKEYDPVVQLLLPYYDKLYHFGLQKRTASSLIKVPLNQLNTENRIRRLKHIRMDFQKEINAKEQ